MRKVRLEIDAGAEEEVIIRCRKLTPEILRLQRLAEETDLPDVGQMLILRLADREFFVSQSEVLFFETDGRRTAAHTADRMVQCDKTTFCIVGENGKRNIQIYLHLWQFINENKCVSKTVTLKEVNGSIIECSGAPYRVFITDLTVVDTRFLQKSERTHAAAPPLRKKFTLGSPARL